MSDLRELRIGKKVFYQAPNKKADKVIIGKEVFFYLRQKGPYVRSGQSILGALEYDSEADQVRCHECGNWFKDVGQHARLWHDITVDEYKLRHGLSRDAALMCESVRNRHLEVGVQHADEVRERFRPALEARREASSANAAIKRNPHTPWFPEKKNLRGKCHAQILNRLQTLARRLGRSPSVPELAKEGIYPYTLCMTFNVDTVDEVYSLLKMEPLKRQIKQRYPREILREMLLDFYAKHQRLPYRSDFYRGTIPSVNQYVKAFGSMEAAYMEAGLGKLYTMQNTGPVGNGHLKTYKRRPAGDVHYLSDPPKGSAETA